MKQMEMNFIKFWFDLNRSLNSPDMLLWNNFHLLIFIKRWGYKWKEFLFIGNVPSISSLPEPWGTKCKQKNHSLILYECGVRQLSSFFHVVKTLILANNTQRLCVSFIPRRISFTTNNSCGQCYSPSPSSHTSPGLQ